MRNNAFPVTEFPVQAMEPKLSETLPVGDYIYQVKWDGFRWIAYHGSQGIVFQTKRGRIVHEWFPELLPSLTWLKPESIVDGEVVCLRAGKPHFPSLLKRMKSRPTGALLTPALAVEYVIFDLLVWQGENFRTRPLAERLNVLAGLVPQDDRCQVIENFFDGPELWRATAERGLEGVVAKERVSPYRPGKDRSWQKVKHWQEGEFFVGGVKVRGGMIQSLSIGLDLGGDFNYVASISTGLERLSTSLAHQPIEERESSPFTGPGPTWETGEEIHWLKPNWPVKVRFLEWTEEGRLRHAQIK